MLRNSPIAVAMADVLGCYGPRNCYGIVAMVINIIPCQ